MRLSEPSGSLQITVDRDDLIELVLEDIPGAGYLWQIEVSGPLSIRDPQAESEATIMNGPVGAGATRLWRIAPTGLGHGVISGSRGQPWEPAERDRAFILQVDVISADHHDGGRRGSQAG